MPSPQFQRNQAPKRALKHQCVFDLSSAEDFYQGSLRQKTWQNKSSFFLTDGALAEWEAPKSEALFALTKKSK